MRKGYMNRKTALGIIGAAAFVVVLLYLCQCLKTGSFAV